MKKTFFISLIAIFAFQNTHSQTPKGKVLVAKYKLYPYSTIGQNPNASSERKAHRIALSRTKEFKYTLLTDFKSDKAVFFLDSIITTAVKGKEKMWIDPEDVVYYAYKKGKNSYKKEVIFKREFFTVSKDFSYEWEITDETKKIAGFNCTKAISKVKNSYIIAWFTNEIPINYGPLNLYGLPGFILKTEDFFKTITIESIKYQDNTKLLLTKIKEYEEKYNKEKLKNEIKESIFLLKKSELIESLKRMH